MAKAMTTSDFIQRAKLVHGDKYDYSNTSYVNMRFKVGIVCPEHGLFEQLPQAHLKGQGCPICGFEKQKQSMLAKYGVDNPMKSRDVCDKARQTCLVRYGHEWARSNKIVQQKAVETNRKIRNVDYPLQSDVVRENMKQTVRNRYGKDFVGQVEEFREKARKTSIARYGSEEPLAAKSVRQKIIETNFERYGGSAPMSSIAIQKKARTTCLSKYGVMHPSQCADVICKINATKAKNGTFGTSDSEMILYDMLCDRFGEADIKRQYSSDKYPFLCDYYIISQDIYIELNAHWSHGGHWFSDDSDDDEIVLKSWLDKGTKYYKNAAHVWSCVDLKKRECAEKNNLNYIVFWDTDLRDAVLWFSLGCPDGRDYEKEYSWLPVKDFSDICLTKKLTGTASNLSAVAKSYQALVFYHREINLWQENKAYKHTRLQIWLYANRLRYLGKSPDVLTVAEILRGFTISGLLKGYTVFDTRLMSKVIKKYNIKSVYDPCAGWGERLLYCYCNDIIYCGCDINTNLEYGYSKMKSDYGIEKQTVYFQDSSKFIPSFEADAVVTCPPYGNIEIYSDKGAENFDEEDFIEWWDRVVKNSMYAKVKYFCFQINQKWKQKLISVVQQNGFDFVEELVSEVTRSGCFARRNGMNHKREYESMIILKRHC